MTEDIDVNDIQRKINQAETFVPKSKVKNTMSSTKSWRDSIESQNPHLLEEFVPDNRIQMRNDYVDNDDIVVNLSSARIIDGPMSTLKYYDDDIQDRKIFQQVIDGEISKEDLYREASNDNSMLNVVGMIEEHERSKKLLNSKININDKEPTKRFINRSSSTFNETPEELLDHLEYLNIKKQNQRESVDIDLRMHVQTLKELADNGGIFLDENGNQISGKEFISGKKTKNYQTISQKMKKSIDLKPSFSSEIFRSKNIDNKDANTLKGVLTTPIDRKKQQTSINKVEITDSLNRFNNLDL